MYPRLGSQVQLSPLPTVFKKKIYLFYVYECGPKCLYMNHMRAVTTEARRGRWILWNWSYRQL